MNKKHLLPYKLSLLGLVLLAASTVVAAVMPKNTSNTIEAAGYSITDSTDEFCANNQLSCAFTFNASAAFCTGDTKTSISTFAVFCATSETDNGASTTAETANNDESGTSDDTLAGGGHANSSISPL